MIETVNLSPSSLSDFEKCPRCFWLDKNHGIKKPRGAFPSLPGGLDRIIKTYCDRHRAAGTLPPEFVAVLGKKARLFADQATMKRWRFWKTAPRISGEGFQLGGAFDEVVQFADGTVSPLDYKTRGSALTPDKNPAEYYQTQLDCYDVMLQGQTLKTTGQAYLTYWTPNEVLADPEGLSTFDAQAMLRFDVGVYTVKTNPERALDLCRQAVECLNGAMPEPGDDKYTGGKCEVCTFAAAVREIS